ncbi:MAG: hypothetical protein JO180_01460 [Gemmatirosa sp.]|nr:hypothetical protein [Gemmatirosa sp.]
MPRPTAGPSRRPTGTPSRARARWLVGPAAVALFGAGVVGCGGTDPFAPVASFTTSLDSFVVYPVTGSPAAAPTAVSLYTRSAVRPALLSGLVLNFDLAFDVDATGRVRLLPPKQLVASTATSLVTGAQVITNTTFDALLRAPNTGYQYDSATVVTPGQLVVIQTQGASTASVACSSTSPMYAKLVVDSVVPSTQIPGTKAIYFRARIDPNCGFRSLDTGVPTN